MTQKPKASSETPPPRPVRKAAKRSTRRRRTTVRPVLVGIGSLSGLLGIQMLARRGLFSTMPTSVSVPRFVLAALALYAGVFVVGISVILIAALISIHNETTYRRCTDLMLRWAYIFSFRFSSVLPR